MIRWHEILGLMANVELKTFPKVGNFELKSYPMQGLGSLTQIFVSDQSPHPTPWSPSIGHNTDRCINIVQYLRNRHNVRNFLRYKQLEISSFYRNRRIDKSRKNRDEETK